MKRLFILMLALILLSSTAIAESAPAREFTVDEQAYDAYLDISYVHNQSVRYLSELGRLWDLANDLDDISDADELWFHAGLVANFGNSDSENGSRLLKFHLLATEKYGFNQVPDLYPAFKTFLSAYSGKTTDIIWAGLAMGIEAQYLISPDELKTYLDEAMQEIRSIMSKDREYPFLKELQNYYKEASYLLDYISNFEDNYIGCQEILDTQKKNQSSYTIDFEFIFDPADFDYVMEVGAAEAEEKERIIYDHAFSLENSGDYAGAIDLYWQCGGFKDAQERIELCHNAIQAVKSSELEKQYQLAISKENSADYAGAIDLYVELGNYKDASLRHTLCMQYTKDAPVTSKKQIAHYSAYLMPAGTSEIQTYSYDSDGKLVSIELTGIRYDHKFSDLITFHYNENGFLTTGTQVYTTIGTEHIDAHIYDAHGNPVKTSRISTNGDTSQKMETEHIYTYNEKGEIETQITITSALTQTKTYVYEYDEAGNKISAQLYLENPIMKKKLMSTTTYKYDRYGRIEKEVIEYTSSGMQEILYSY